MIINFLFILSKAYTIATALWCHMEMKMADVLHDLKQMAIENNDSELLVGAPTDEALAKAKANTMARYEKAITAISEANDIPIKDVIRFVTLESEKVGWNQEWEKYSLFLDRTADVLQGLDFNMDALVEEAKDILEKWQVFLHKNQ